MLYVAREGFAVRFTLFFSPVFLYLNMFPTKHSKHPVVAFAKETPIPNVALYHDVGYGLRRARSQRRRAFRLPIVYSNSLADLCVPCLTWLWFS